MRFQVFNKNVYREKISLEDMLIQYANTQDNMLYCPVTKNLHCTDSILAIVVTQDTPFIDEYFPKCDNLFSYAIVNAALNEVMEENTIIFNEGQIFFVPSKNPSERALAMYMNSDTRLDSLSCSDTTYIIDFDTITQLSNETTLSLVVNQSMLEYYIMCDYTQEKIDTLSREFKKYVEQQQLFYKYVHKQMQKQIIEKDSCYYEK